MQCVKPLLNTAKLPTSNDFGCRCRTRAGGSPDRDCLASGHTCIQQQSPPCRSWMTPMRARTALLCWQATAMACPSPASMRAILGATCRWAGQKPCPQYCISLAERINPVPVCKSLAPHAGLVNLVASLYAPCLFPHHVQHEHP